MKITRNKIWLFSLCVMFFTCHNSTIIAAKNYHSEILLDQLEIVTSVKDAESLRSKIWNTWINDISMDHQNKLQLALSKLESGSLKSAEDAFSELLKLDPSYMEGWNKRATIRYLLGDLEGSLADINKVLSLQSRHFGAISGLALIYMSQKKYKKALRSYSRLKEIDPMNLDSKKFIPILEGLVYGIST